MSDLMECLICQQALRLPVICRKTRIRCPTCKTNYVIQPCSKCSQLLRLVDTNKKSRIKCPICQAIQGLGKEDRAQTNAHYDHVNFSQGTKEWLDWRDLGIGASDAPTIMQENPWQTRGNLLHQKRNKIRIKPTFKMIRGHELEEPARSLFIQKTGIQVRPVCLVSSENRWMRASLDGLSSDGRHVVEIKCGEGTYWHSHRHKNVPRYYYGQIQHILKITGLDFAHYWAYHPDYPPIHIEVPRNDIYILDLINEEKIFWNELNIN